MGLAIYFAVIGFIGAFAGGVVIYRNRDILFPKHTKQQHA
jgi:hypothetical protein